MAVVLVLVAILIGYFWLSARGRRKDERRALRRFNFTRRMTDTIGQDWTADFVEMKLVVKGYDWDGVPEGSGFDTPSLYSLRRHEGEWEARMDEVTRRAEAERLDREVKKGDGGSLLVASRIEDQKKALADLQEPKWVPIDGEIAGPLETQYHASSSTTGRAELSVGLAGDRSSDRMTMAFCPRAVLSLGDASVHDSGLARSHDVPHRAT